MEGERIAKIIARAGFCSRRDAEQWIAEGRIAVNGKIITSPALNVTASDMIEIDGTSISMPREAKLWLFNKPLDVITTHKDPQGRKTVFDVLPKSLGRIISVGRLDVNTEGLLLLTNSGTLAHHLENPKTAWVRRYRARVYGKIDENGLAKIAKGLTIKDPKTGENISYGPIQARLEKKGDGKNHWISLSIKEGKNREIRNICQHLGLEVSRLIRVAYGPFQLGNLKAGEIQEVPQKVLHEQLGKSIMDTI